MTYAHCNKCDKRQPAEAIGKRHQFCGGTFVALPPRPTADDAAKARREAFEREAHAAHLAARERFGGR